MRRQKMPLSLPLSTIAAATTAEIVSTPVQSNHIMCVQRLAVRDINNGATTARYLKRNGGKDFLLADFGALTANVLKTDTTQVFFTEGEQLVISFTGVTSSDNLEAYAHGFIVAGDEDNQPEGD